MGLWGLVAAFWQRYVKATTVEIVSYDINSTGGFVLPSSLNKSANGTSYNHIGMATHLTMNNISTNVIGVNLHVRAST